MDTDPWALARAAMVAQLRTLGIRQARVLAAMAAVPRHAFVPEDEQPIAYADRPLPIGHGQTISQPYVVARMAELLELTPGDHLLEVGGGSGYAAAVFARLVARVVCVEYLPALAERARDALARLGYRNVLVLPGDGARGYPAEAPYQAIAFAAAAPEVPPPVLAQLADDGRLLAPLGSLERQHLTRLTRHGTTFTRETFGEVAFVPLRGEYGWAA